MHAREGEKRTREEKNSERGACQHDPQSWTEIFEMFRFLYS